jgi:hypothetical protein
MRSWGNLAGAAVRLKQRAKRMAAGPLGVEEDLPLIVAVAAGKPATID